MTEVLNQDNQIPVTSTVHLVADDILKIAKRRGVSLTPMQLMKLVYIAYGWHLAMNGARLFRSNIEAWKYGPVIPELYKVIKRFGRDEIPSELISDLPITNSELNDFLESIVDNYGHYSGIALSNLTHMQGTPWHQVFRPNIMNIQIPDDLIREHYLRGLNDRQSSSSATS
jgi:uncharacterized phage-associated protein